MNIPYRVLIVDDDEEMQKLYQIAFDKAIVPIIAGTAEEGLTRFAEEPNFAAIAVDGNLPGAMDGPSFVRAIRGQFRGPIIANSSDMAAGGKQEELMSAGCDHQSTKHKLPRILEDILDVHL